MNAPVHAAMIQSTIKMRNLVPKFSDQLLQQLMRLGHWSKNERTLLPQVFDQCNQLLSSEPVDSKRLVQQLGRPTRQSVTQHQQHQQQQQQQQPDSLLICYQSHKPNPLIKALKQAGINTVAVSLNADKHSWTQAINAMTGEKQSLLALFDDHHRAPTSTIAANPLATRALLHIQQLFGHLQQHSAIRVWLAVRNLHCNCAAAAALSSPSALTAAVVWGAAKSLTHEYPQQFAGIIDLNDEDHLQTSDIIRRLSDTRTIC